MPRPLASTGDTQAICIEKPDSFVEWCLRVTEEVIERQSVLSTAKLEKPRKRRRTSSRTAAA